MKDKKEIENIKLAKILVKLPVASRLSGNPKINRKNCIYV